MVNLPWIVSFHKRCYFLRVLTLDSKRKEPNENIDRRVKSSHKSGTCFLVCLFLLEIGTLFISDNVLSFTRRVVSYFVLPLVPNTLPLVGSAEYHGLKNLSVTNPEGVNPVKYFGTGGPEFGPADKFR